MFLGIGDPAYPHNARAWDASGNVWKPSDALYVAWDDADFEQYRIPATPRGDSGRFYSDDIPSDAADWELVQQGSTLVDERVVDYRSQTYIVPQDLTVLDRQPFDSVNMAGFTGVHFEKGYLISGLDSSDWEQFVFTLKRNKDTDDDSDSLLMVRLSNPADPATDGLLIKNAKPVDSASPDRATATIVVSTVSPDTNITLILKAAAMDLPPSPTSAPFNFEIDYWVGGEKMPFASGLFIVNRSVRRAIAAP